MDGDRVAIVVEVEVKDRRGLLGASGRLSAEAARNQLVEFA